MSCDSLENILSWSSPLVDAVQQGILLWVAFRLRGISSDVQSTSQGVEVNSERLRRLHADNGSPHGAQDQKK